MSAWCGTLGSVKRPIIETERLVLRPFVISDADAVYAYCSDPQVARFTSWEPHRSAADSESFIRFCTEHFDLSPDTLFVPLAICVRDGPAVGSVTLAATEAGCRVDFALARHLWNEGLVTEAARAMIDWAFDSYPELKVVESGGMSANPRQCASWRSSE